MTTPIPSRVLPIAGMLLALAAFETDAWPQLPSTPPPVVASMKIEGLLTKIEGRYYVIKDAHGKEVYLHISPDTTIAGTFKIGDRIGYGRHRSNIPLRFAPA